MKQTKRLFYLIFLMMVVSGTSVIETFAQDYTKEKLAIQKLVFDMGDALMDKDWERYQSYFVQDTTLNVVHPDEMDWATGWQAVKRRYMPLFGPEVNLQTELESDKFKVYLAPGGKFAWARNIFKASKPFASSGAFINFMTAEETDRIE
jgi:hypothetical protein